MSPRSTRCPRPAASGIPSRSRPRAHISSWCSTTEDRRYAAFKARPKHCDRPRDWPDQTDDHAGARLRRMGVFGLAGLPGLGDGGSPSDGRGADLCPALCPVPPGRDRRAGRSRRARPCLQTVGSDPKNGPPVKGNGSGELRPPPTRWWPSEVFKSVCLPRKSATSASTPVRVGSAPRCARFQ